MYKPRSRSELEPVAATLADDGIAVVDDVYSVNELGVINAAMNPKFKERSGLARSYVTPDEMLDLGILSRVLSQRMLDLLFSVIPDPVLYHFHVYEIAGNANHSHIFGDRLAGWHRDPDSKYYIGDPTHVSLFVYLSNVSREDGTFQFSVQRPEFPLHTASPIVTMQGPIGLSFAWHRSFHHRAAPNRGPRRRRLLKISIQRNEFPSAHLSNKFFSRLKAALPPGNPAMDLLLGRYQQAQAPVIPIMSCVAPRRVSSLEPINLSSAALADVHESFANGAEQQVAYD